MEQTKQDSLLQKLNRIKIYEMGLPLYLCVFALVFVAMLLGWLPGGMLGAFLVMMVYGGLFNLIGNNTPIVKTYLGGGAIVCIFASAILVYLGVIPEKVVINVNGFMNTTGFLNFYIAALITGSILGMSRSLLLRAAIRFLPVALCAMAMGCLLVGVVGMVLGAGLGGQMVGFYPIESASTAGLCTTNMGGTGDIAVLSAADRMVLLPFAQISTRICGAVVLVVASILVRVLF